MFLFPKEQVSKRTHIIFRISLPLTNQRNCNCNQTSYRLISRNSRKLVSYINFTLKFQGSQMVPRCMHSGSKMPTMAAHVGFTKICIFQRNEARFVVQLISDPSFWPDRWSSQPFPRQRPVRESLWTGQKGHRGGFWADECI